MSRRIVKCPAAAINPGSASNEELEPAIVGLAAEIAESKRNIQRLTRKCARRRVDRPRRPADSKPR